MSIRGNWLFGETLYASDTNDTFNNVVDIMDTAAGGKGVNGTLAYPIGSVMAWLKSFPNTPVLTAGWVECNGQILSDAESPYNGITLPNLNSTNYFLRGHSTSGSTGGALSHAHYMYGGGYGYNFVYHYGMPLAPAYTYAAANTPPYYDVVWIMRIK